MSKISDALLEELKRAEGVRSTVYDDLTGKSVASFEEVQGAPTIAIGRKIQDHEKSFFANFLAGRKKLEGTQLNAVIKDTIDPREKKLAGVVKVPVTQSMFDSLFSFAFNTGFGSKFFKSVLEKLNAGDYTGAQQAIAQGPQSAGGKPLPGLVKRRAFEAELFAKEGLAPTSSVLPLAGPYGTMYEIDLSKIDERAKGVVKLDDKALWAITAVKVGAAGAAGYVLGAGAGHVFKIDDTRKWGFYGAGIAGTAAAATSGVQIYRLYQHGKKV